MSGLDGAPARVGFGFGFLEEERDGIVAGADRVLGITRQLRLAVQDDKYPGRPMDNHSRCGVVGRARLGALVV
jgi:hypothetical protein